MAGIGEASAIVGILQGGFSLATVLNTYISDVSDAGDDIASLVSDIEATFGQLRDLGKLIEKNKTAKAWSEDGLRNAEKCVTDCEKIITKLRKLLKKSTASATLEEVSRDEIDISKLERARWPFIKPQMEIRRRELQRIKQDIMIAYSSYMTQVGTAADRKKFTDDLPRLQRRRALARRQVREAKNHRRRQVANHQRASQSRLAPGASLSDDGGGSAPDDVVPLIYNDIDDLEREFKAWKAEEEQRKADEEAERKMIQEEAVKSWKEQQLREIEVRRRKNEDERSSLRAELTKQRVTPQQIEDIINHVHPQEQVNSDLRLFSLDPTSDKASSVASVDSSAKTTSSRRWSIWSKRKSSSGQQFLSTSTLVNESRAVPIPDFLRDPTAEGGIAPLEASYFQRSLEVPPSIQNFNVEIPNQWLLDSLIKRQEAVAHDPKQVNSVWKEFSQLPSDYRHAISEHIDNKLRWGPSGVIWVLLHLERMFEQRRPGMFDRGGRKEVVGIYLVLKRNKKPRDHIVEREDHGKKNDRDSEWNMHHIEIVEPRSSHGHMPQQITHDSPTRHRSNKSGYVPRHDHRNMSREASGSSSHRPTKETFSSEHQEPRVYDGVDFKIPEGDPPYIFVDSQSQQRELSPERNSSRPSVVTWRPPQRRSHERDQIHYATDSGHSPRPVSIGETPASRAGYLYPQYPASYSSHPPPPAPSTVYVSPIPIPGYPYLSSGNNHINPRYDTNSAPDQRNGMHGSYHLNDSPINLGQRLSSSGYSHAEEIELPGRHQPARLSDIVELSEESDVSVSSEESDKEGLSHRTRLRPRETDEELLDKTLKEYVNPLRPPQGGAGPESPVSATGDATKSEEPSTTTL